MGKGGACPFFDLDTEWAPASGLSPEKFRVLDYCKPRGARDRRPSDGSLPEASPDRAALNKYPQTRKCETTFPMLGPLSSRAGQRLVWPVFNAGTFAQPTEFEASTGVSNRQKKVHPTPAFCFYPPGFRRLGQWRTNR